VTREHVLKVRLSTAELARLDALVAGYGFRTRAAAVRAVLRGAEPPEVMAPVAGPSLEALLEGLRSPLR
jgi:hypothetical protein